MRWSNGNFLGEEGAERLILPRLEIARRPVVEQRQPSDKWRAASPIGDRCAQRIAFADPHAELELIESSRCVGSKIGASALGGLVLAARADDGLARGAYRRRAPMIADRHIFIIGEQRIVGPELPPDIVRMMDADIESV